MPSIPIGCLVLCLALAAPSPGQLVPVLQRPVDSAAVTIPMDTLALLRTLSALARRTRTPFGVESLPTSFPPPPQPARRSSQRLDLGGLPLGDALQLLFEHVPQYRWQNVDGVIVVQPKPENGGKSVLDMDVVHFSIQEATAHEALCAVHRLFDPQFPARMAGTGRAGGVQLDAGRRAEVERGMAKKITVTLSNTTVRGVLNAIVAAFGEMSYDVTYSDEAASYEHSQFTFRSADGWAVSVSPLRR